MHHWDPKDYHESSSEQEKWARELLAKLDLKGNERVLDIGCGDGKVTADIASQLPEGSAVGIDSSAEMIRFAQERFPSVQFPNLTFEVMDARELSFDAEFDAIFSNATLHWVTDHLPVLEGIKRSLKPFGKVLLQMGGTGNAAGILEVLPQVTSREKWKGNFDGFPFPYAFYGPEEYKDWLDRVGLRAKRVELVPKVMSHKGREGLAGWIRTTWLPYTQRVPEELRDEFINEIVDRYVENHPLDSEGYVKVRMARLEVEV